MKHNEGIWRFRNRLPQVDERCMQTLGEGDTPLLRFRDTGVWVKADHINPTSSFKDRGVAFLISKIVEEGASTVVIDSSGNAAVSTAAYCAHAGLRLIAVMPKYSHHEKKLQILWHGARVIEAQDRDTARLYARRLSKELGLRYVGFALEPHAVPGFKTAAYEIAEEFAPDAVFVPTGSGTNIVALGSAFIEMREMGEVVRVPEMHCVQSAACAPIAGVFTDYAPVESTLAEGVIVPVTERKNEAVRVIRETGGTGWVVDDGDIYRALGVLASNGIYASPTGAVGVAGALKAGIEGRCVCIVTDSGLKSNLTLPSFKERITPIGDESELDRFVERELKSSCR
jgi:threonine synthase